MARADHDLSPKPITERIILDVFDADLCVADLTDMNPNVYYELSLRHCSGKVVIQMAEDGVELPFDLKDQNTVFFKDSLNGRAKAIADLRMAWEHAKTGAHGNPIQNAIGFRDAMDQLKMQSAGNPSSELAAVANLLQSLTGEIGSLRAEVSRIKTADHPVDDGRQLAARHGIGQVVSQLASQDKRLKERGFTHLMLTMDGTRYNISAYFEDGSVLSTGGFLGDIKGPTDYLDVLVRGFDSIEAKKAEDAAKKEAQSKPMHL
jgi:hypothetical protein